jgi:hypothetical protein
MLEKEVEKKCGDIAKRYGCLWLKWSSPSQRGVPDRILICPGGRVVFIEVKRPGGKLTALQGSWLRKLNRQGVLARCVDDPAVFEACLQHWCGVAGTC